MFVFPAVITPTVMFAIMPIFLVPVALIVLIIWQATKLKSIDEKLADIQEKLRDR